MKFLMTQCNVKEEELTARLVCFGAHEVSTFKWGHFRFVTRPIFAKIMASVKKQCEKIVSELITKLQGPRSITSRKFDGCIWYCVPTILITIKIRNKVCCSFGSSQRCLLLT
jgi:hypothetical protein